MPQSPPPSRSALPWRDFSPWRSWRSSAAASTCSTDLPTCAAAVHVAFSSIYGQHASVWVNFLLHLACWIASTLEAWLALRFAGAPLGFATVLVIESLLYAARSAAFAVPNAVGVQEGAYILLGAVFGRPP